METQMVIILIVIYCFTAIILALDIYFIVRHFKNKKRANTEKALVGSEKNLLFEEVNKINNFIHNSKFIGGGKYKINKSDFVLSGHIIINSYGLFVLNQINDLGNLLEGDFNSREWFLHTDKFKYCINNLFWSLNKNIQDILPLLPNNLPVIGVLIFDNVKEFEINNYPGHLAYTHVSDLCNFMYEIKKSLKPILTTQNVEKIYELLTNKRIN